MILNFIEHHGYVEILNYKDASRVRAIRSAVCSRRRLDVCCNRGAFYRASPCGHLSCGSGYRRLVCAARKNFWASSCAFCACINSRRASFAEGGSCSIGVLNLAAEPAKFHTSIKFHFRSQTEVKRKTPPHALLDALRKIAVLAQRSFAACMFAAALKLLYRTDAVLIKF